jgi:LacI family transcriptional regulator
MPKPGKRQLRRVLLLVNAADAFSSRKLPGVFAWLDRNPHWEVLSAMPAQFEVLEKLEQTSCDGVLGAAYGGEMQRLAGRGIPTVTLSTASPHTVGVCVYPDHDLAGRMALEHFTDRGIVSFGSFRHEGSGQYAGAWRERAFAAEAARRGLPCSLFRSPPRPDIGWREDLQLRDLADWLAPLPKPIGVLCSDDLHGQRLLLACRVAGLQVPDQVAVLGVHNDPALCEGSKPTLSSLAMDQEEAGRTAAALLDEMMAGRSPEVTEVRIPPRYIVERGSTRLFVTDDPLVSAAIKFMADHLEQSSDVEDVVKHIGLSRSALHRRFKKALGRSVGEELRRVRTDRVLQLLMTTNLPLVDVAVRCGYGNTPQVVRDVKDRTGKTPIAYRQQFRTGF